MKIGKITRDASLRKINHRRLCDVLRDYNLGPSNLTRQSKADLQKIASEFICFHSDKAKVFGFIDRINTEISAQSHAKSSKGDNA